MPIDIVVPPLSQTSDSLTFIGWLKAVGDPVSKGEALFEVETDKATLQVESPASGRLHEALAEPGDEVAVRSRIGSIAAPEAAAEEAPPPANMGTLTDTPRADANLAGTPASAAAAPRAARILASPRARGLADKEDVPLTAIMASGPRGMIVEADVRAYLSQRDAAGQQADSLPLEMPAVESAAAPEPLAAGSQRAPLTATRRSIARRLQANQQTTVPVTLTRDVDATALAELRERLLRDLASQDVRPTFTDLLVSIAARCLKRHPRLNATFDGEMLETYDSVHMSLAVDTERGLLAPVLRNAAQKGLLSLARERSLLVQRARAGTLRAEEMAGGTFTLTNLGALGVDAFTPLLNPPQIAILGIGRIRTAMHSSPALKAMFLSLTFDHRAVDGAPAARLLADIAALVEQPDRIWLEPL